LFLYSLLVVFLFPVHELAHYSAYRLLGIDVPITLNTASPQNPALRQPIAELAGPLLNLAVATVAAALYLKGRSHHRWLGELALAAALMRLVVYGLVGGAAVVTGSGLALGNDEPIAAHLWGLPALTFVALFAVPFLWIVGAVARVAWEGSWRRARHVLGRAGVTFGVGIVIGTVLDPWLFPHR
jgi:hypothetical protein